METFDRFRNHAVFKVFSRCGFYHLPNYLTGIDPVWRRCLQSLPFYVKGDPEYMNQVVSEYMGAVVDNWCVLGATKVSEDSEWLVRFQLDLINLEPAQIRHLTLEKVKTHNANYKANKCVNQTIEAFEE
jgi:hypothetical protein